MVLIGRKSNSRRPFGDNFAKLITVTVVYHFYYTTLCNLKYALLLVLSGKFNAFFPDFYTRFIQKLILQNILFPKWSFKYYITRFFSFLTTYPPLVDIFEGISLSLCSKIYLLSLTFLLSPTYLFLST